jgi:hypothetical protein
MAALVGMKEIANYVRRSESTVIIWISQMEFPAKKIGGIWETTTEKADAWKQGRFEVEEKKGLQSVPIRNKSRR